MSKSEDYIKQLRALIRKSKPRSRICQKHSFESPWVGGGHLYEVFDEVIRSAQEAIDNQRRGYFGRAHDFIKEAERVIGIYRRAERDVAQVIRNSDMIYDQLPFIIDKDELGHTVINIPRGGKRAGAGSKNLIGVTKKVSITLPEKEWEKINELIQTKVFESYSHYFRTAQMKFNDNEQ